MDDTKDSDGPDVLAAFYVIGSNPNEVISGWIALEEGKDEFLETIFEEMEYTLHLEITDQHMYKLYYVDSKKGNRLTVIPDQKVYDQVKKLDPIMLMVLHKNVNKEEVENHPRYAYWLEETE